MKDVIMQFPNVNGSTLYDGRGHFIDPISAAKVGNTNIYVLDYNDLNLKKRSRALVQKTAKGLTHIPLMNKTGLNRLYDKFFDNSVNIVAFMNGIIDIGITKTQPDLETFLKLIKQERKAKINDSDEFVNFINNARESVGANIQRDAIIVHEDSSRDYVDSRRELNAQPDYVAPKYESKETDRGDLGWFSHSPAAVGPGRQSGFGRPLLYAGGMRPGMPGPNGGPAPMGPMDGPIPPREGPIEQGPIEEGPIEEAPQGPKL